MMLGIILGCVLGYLVLYIFDMQREKKRKLNKK